MTIYKGMKYCIKKYFNVKFVSGIITLQPSKRSVFRVRSAITVSQTELSDMIVLFLVSVHFFGNTDQLSTKLGLDQALNVKRFHG
jgi:hypothetical protein